MMTTMLGTTSTTTAPLRRTTTPPYRNKKIPSTSDGSNTKLTEPIPKRQLFPETWLWNDLEIGYFEILRLVI